MRRCGPITNLREGHIVRLSLAARTRWPVLRRAVQRDLLIVPDERIFPQEYRAGEMRRALLLQCRIVRTRTGRGRELRPWDGRKCRSPQRCRPNRQRGGLSAADASWAAGVSRGEGRRLPPQSTSRIHFCGQRVPHRRAGVSHRQ